MDVILFCADLSAYHQEGAIMAAVEQASVELRPLLRGSYLDLTAPQYEQARALYNAMIDKRPAEFARCVHAADVVAAVRYAREQDLRVMG